MCRRAAEAAPISLTISLFSAAWRTHPDATLGRACCLTLTRVATRCRSLSRRHYSAERRSSHRHRQTRSAATTDDRCRRRGRRPVPPISVTTARHCPDSPRTRSARSAASGSDGVNHTCYAGLHIEQCARPAHVASHPAGHHRQHGTGAAAPDGEAAEQRVQRRLAGSVDFPAGARVLLATPPCPDDIAARSRRLAAPDR